MVAGKPVTVTNLGGCRSCVRSRGRVFRNTTQGHLNGVLMHGKPGEEGCAAWRVVCRAIGKARRQAPRWVHVGGTTKSVSKKWWHPKQGHRTVVCSPKVPRPYRVGLCVSYTLLTKITHGDR